MKNNIFFRIITFCAVLSILLQSSIPFLSAFSRPVAAQDITPTESVSPTSEPTPPREDFAGQAVTITPTAEPTVEPTQIVEPTVALTIEPTPTSSPNLEDSAGQAESITPTATPTAIPSPWTFERVELNKEYVAPQNSGVKLTFTKLPTPSGNIKIEEITLTAEQIKQTGSLSDKAYDITSDMKDGEFNYNLSLPIPENSKGKAVNVKFAEELSKIDAAENVENILTKTNTTVSVKNLNHFTIFIVTKLQPDYATPGGSGVFSAYVGPPAYGYVSPGATATYNGREAGIIKAGINIDTDGHYWDEGLFAFKPTVTINAFAGNPVNYDVQNAAGVNPVWMTIEIDTGIVNDRSDNVTYQFVPTSNPSGWHTVDAAAGSWQKWNNGAGDTTGNPLISLSAIATAHTGLNVARAYLRLGMGDSYNNSGTGTIAWVDKVTFGGQTYDFKIIPACDSSSFDASALGSVNGQGGWTVTGPYDQAVVENIYGYSSFGCKTLRLSDSVTSGSFGDQVFAPPQVNGAGESSATSAGFTLGTRQNHFEAQFDIASAVPTQQTGMHVSISPDRGDGARMSYLRIEDNSGGLDVFFDDVQGTDSSANFVETKVSAGLDRTTPHTIKFVMDFKDGPSNDIVEIWIDGTLAHTGTSWENYYRYDGEASSEQSPRIVKTLLFRESGTATPANSGNGFLFDNVNLSSSIIPPDTTAPAVPTLVSPADGAYVKPSGLILDWTDSTDPSLPVTYVYQSSYSSSVGVNNGLTSPIYNASTGTVSQIDASGSGDATYYWQVKACDSLSNCSDWSGPWAVTVDNIAPTVPLNGMPHNQAINTNNFDFTWDSSTDASSVTYEFQSSLSSTSSGGVLTSGLWHSGVLPTAMIHSSGAPDGKWYWQVRAIDAAGNTSAWSTIWNVTLDTVAPAIPTGLKFQSQDRLTDYACGAYLTSLQVVIPDWNDITGDPSFARYEYTSFHPSGAIGLDESPLTVSELVNSWVPPTDGAYGYAVRSVDTAGNKSAWALSAKILAGSCQIIYDSAAPTKPVFTAPANNLFTNVNAVTLTWSGGDDNGTNSSGIKGYTIRYTFVPLGGGATINWTSGLIVSGNPKTHSGTYGHGQGTYTLYVSTTDNAGNVSPESDALVLSYDATSPSIVLTDDQTDAIVRDADTVTITATFTESDQIDETVPPTISIHSVGIVNDALMTKVSNLVWAYVWDVPSGNDGVHSVTISAKDRAGNVNTSATGKVSYTIDNTSPAVTTKSIFSGWYTTDQTSTFTYTDTNGIASGTPVTCTISTEGTAQTCTVTPNVCDVAGNCNTTLVTSNGADIDKTNPSSTISSPSNSGNNSVIYSNSWNGAVSGAATDATSGVNGVQVSIQKGTTQYFDGSTFVDSAVEILLTATYAEGSWQYTGLTSPDEATYTVKSHAIDNATNVESTYSLTIIFDKTIPQVAISLNPAVADASNGWYKTQPEVALTATDSYFDRIEYQWDSQTGPWITYTAPFKPATEGARVLYYRAHDLADNYSGVGIKNIKWNKTDLKNGPLNVSVSPNPTSEFTSKVKWDAATSDTIGIDRYEVQWKLKNGDKSYTVSVGNGVREYTVDNLLEGIWEVKVTAFDASGNSKSASVDLTVDRTGPSAPTLSVTGTTVGSVSLSWTKISDAVDYIIWYGTAPGTYLYGARVGDIQSYTVQGLGGGSYYFIVRAVDGTGNQSGNSNEVSSGAIVGAPGVGVNTPAQGFNEEVLGTNTLSPTPTLSPTATPTPEAGEVLGSETGTGSKPWWWPWILLLLLPPGWFGYKKWKNRKE